MSQDQPVPAKSSAGSILLKILLVLLIAVGAFAGYVASKPNDYRIERSQTMAATPEVIFAQLNDLRLWDGWSPWAKLDPNAEIAFSGPETGVDASFSWSGNKQIGEGKMTITQSKPSTHLEYRLEFEKPMKDIGMSEFRLEPAGEQTKVTWATFGTYQNFFHKAMCTVMNMDAILGPRFEAGLSNLKNVVELKASEMPPDNNSTNAPEESPS